LVRRDGFEAEAFSEVPSAWGHGTCGTRDEKFVPRYFCSSEIKSLRRATRLEHDRRRYAGDKAI